MYLIRNGKIEFTGSKHEIVEYIKDVYPEEYSVELYWDQLEKDNTILRNVILDLGMNYRQLKQSVSCLITPNGCVVAQALIPVVPTVFLTF